MEFNLPTLIGQHFKGKDIGIRESIPDHEFALRPGRIAKEEEACKCDEKPEHQAPAKSDAMECLRVPYRHFSDHI